jgi:hypothetical protein
METLKKVPGWAEQILLPRLNGIEGELKAINSRIDSTNTSLSARIDSTNARLSAKIDVVKSNIESLGSEFRAEFKAIDTKLDQFEKRLEQGQRIAVLETEVKELKMRG